MSPASAPKTEAPPVEDAPAPPPADHETAERPDDVKPFE
jgi:hypothetical protein